MLQMIEFESENAILRGRFYKAANRPPCIVMAHGTSATITMATDSVAEAFYRAGYSVLLYDHRNLGNSDGEPRFEINPWIQGRGYRDAIAYLRTRPDIDQVALWGVSYSAMEVLVVGALIDNIAAIVAQNPACGAALPNMEPSDASLKSLKELFASGNVQGGPESTVGPVPVVSADQINAPSLLKPIQAFRWFIEHGSRFNTKWQNLASRVVPHTKVPFHPYLTAPYLRVPTLVLIGHHDEMEHCNPTAQRAVFEKITAP